jgi:putative transposase
VAHELKTIYTAQTEEDAQLALTEFNDIWGQRYPHIAQLWINNGNELTTFLRNACPWGINIHKL